MSPDVASRPVRTEPEELVPSRYAVKIGEIDVLVISDGVLPLPTTMLGHNADPKARAAWMHHMFLPPDAFDWALNAVVVRSGGKTILIDAGLGSDPDLNLPRAGQLIKRVESAGINLASVTDIVLTHMHMDHIGGLLVPGIKDRLPPTYRSMWPQPRSVFGTRRISPTRPCHRASRMHCGQLPSGSSRSITTGYGNLTRNTKSPRV